MKYQPPTGGAANDPYVGRNLGAGIQGSRVPPKAIEHPQRELVAIIAAAGITPLDTDVDQVLEALDKLYLRKGIGTSTTKAPKLPGILATGQALGTVTPSSVATKVDFTTITQNNLGSSTFTGADTLTIGADEAGLWLVTASLHWAAPVGGSWASAGVYVNGSEVASGILSQGNSGDAQIVPVTGFMKLSAGDTVSVYGYQQTGSSQTIQASSRTRFSAFLISAF
jgi:hypothetical protein